MPFGLTFAPNQQGPNPQQGGDPNQSAPLQEAIKVLNLRLPTVHGARGLAPAPLMQSLGSGGLPSSMMGGGIEQMLAMLFGALRNSQGVSPQQVNPGQQPGTGSINVPPMVPSAMGGSAPLPKFTPGIQAPGGTPNTQEPPPFVDRPMPPQASQRPPSIFRR